MRELTVPEAPRHARDGPARSLALLLTGSLGGLSVRCDTCARLFRSVDKASQGCVRDGGFGQGRTTRRRIYLAVRTSECTWGGGGGGGGGGGVVDWKRCWDHVPAPGDGHGPTGGRTNAARAPVCVRAWDVTCHSCSVRILLFRRRVRAACRLPRPNLAAGGVGAPRRASQVKLARERPASSWE